MNHICPKFQIWCREKLKINKNIEMEFFQEKSSSSFGSRKRLFLNRWSNSFHARIVVLRCEFSCAKKKKKKKKKTKSNEIVSHRHRYVSMIVDNSRWRKLNITNPRVDIIITPRFAKVSRLRVRCKATFIQRPSLWNDKCHYLEQSWLTYTQYFLLSTRIYIVDSYFYMCKIIIEYLIEKSSIQYL